MFYFSYNLGKGPAVIVSKQRSLMNKWNMLRVHRDGIQGYLELNGERVSGKAKEGLTQLNLDQNMFLGGVPNTPSK